RAVKETDGLWNFNAMLTKLFSDTTSKGWKVAIEQIDIQNSKLILLNKTTSISQGFGVDFNNLAIDNFNCNISLLHTLKGGGVEFSLNSMQGLEQSGFELKQLQSQVYFDGTKIDLQNIDLQTNNSRVIVPHLRFAFNSFSSFSNFLNEVIITSTIEQSTVAFSDIAYFAPSLEYVPYTISIEGSVQGTVADFKARNLTIATGRHTRFSGNVECSGLPNVNETYLYVQSQSLETSYSDIAQFRLPPFNVHKFVNVPPLVRHLSYINYKGNFSGFFTDFVAYGTWNTNLGNFKTDISLAKKADQHIEYSGKIQTSSFDVGTLLSARTMLNRVNMSISTKGSVRNAKYITGKVTGTIQNIDFNQYTYSNIELSGHYTNRKYDGHFAINDPNVLMDFSGLLDFTDTVPVFQFETTVEHAHLFPLNFHPSDTTAQISLQLAVNSNGIELDKLNGEIDIQDFAYSGSIGKYETDNMHIQLDNNQQNRHFDVQSDLFDLSFQGFGNYTELPAYMYDFLRSYIPSLPERFNNTKRTLAPQCNAQIRIKELNNFLQVAVPHLSIAPQSTIEFSFDDVNKHFDFHSKIPFASYKTIQFHNIDVRSNNDNKEIRTTIDVNCDSFAQVTFNNRIERDSAFSHIVWQTTNSVRTEGELFVNGCFKKSLQAFSPTIDLDVQPGQLLIADTLWTIAKSHIAIKDGEVSIKHLAVHKDIQSITIHGDISKEPQKRLSITLDNFNMNNTSQFLANPQIQLEGLVSGTIEARDLFNKRRVYLNIQSPELRLNGHLLGQLNARSRLLPNQNALAVNFSLMQNDAGIAVQGNYNFDTEATNFDINLNTIDLRAFQVFLNGVLNNIQGMVDGNIRMAGKLKQLEFDGALKIQNTSFTVDYTKVPYTLNSDVHISGTQFTFANAHLTDTLNNTGTLQGYIDLKALANPRYVLNIRTPKLLLADIKENQNNVFYGKIMYKGSVGIDGNMNGIQINGVGETLNSSEVNLPLTSSELTQQDFLRFADTTTQTVVVPVATASTFTPEMNLNVRVTPQTIVRIIFDKRVGDIIRVQGTSNLQLKLDKQSNFTIFGEYAMSEGTYLFTLRNLINKLFVIQPNGRIVFNGDPLAAQMDLTAHYELKASPQPIMTDTNYRRTLVTCEINLTDDLLSPDITYNILVPSSSQVQDVIDMMNMEQKNMQFLSLLLMNSFFTPTDASQSINANASLEVLSNQLNNILSQMNLPVDVGVNIRGSDASSDAKEFELELSRALFNNRVLVNVNSYSDFGGTAATTNQNSDFAGDVSVELKLNEQGTFRIKGFSRSNNNPLKETRDNTQGISLFYTKEFNTWREFFRRRKAQQQQLPPKKSDETNNNDDDTTDDAE
ncbi:MAG: translocation/assembly module TamB, partial [Bacteroidales bacterium]|nr:translocation/assembly module TamB [Bacteroidales bacterium]